MHTFIRRYSIKQLSPGMTLANAVVSGPGKVLLTARSVLTKERIKALETNGTIFADVLVNLEPERQASQLQDFVHFIETHDRAVEGLKSIFKSSRAMKGVPANEAKEIVDKDISTMLKSPGVLNFIQAVKYRDEYTFAHSINVSLVCGLFGKWLSYTDLNDLMLAGLLHDIGKVYIPERILNKPGRLSREEMAHIRKHPLHGWDLCHEGGIKSDVVLDGVLSHHERVDGTGYPHALNHHKLSEIAKIVAIADTFDAMSSHRVYRPAVSPFRVMEEIFDEMFKRLDSKLCYMFLDYVKEQMTGSEVVLSSGGRARLVYIDGIGRYRTILQDLSTERCFWEDQPGQCVLELA